MKHDPFAALSFIRILVLLLPVIVTTGCRKCESDAFAGGESLFDGESLDGWMVKCLPKDAGKDYWSVVDGAIEANVPPGSDHKYIWLLTDREYDNFELQLKVQSFSSGKLNSGVQVRSRYDDEAGWLDGPQVDIHPSGGWRSGFIYDETRTVKAWLSPIQGKPSAATEADAIDGWSWQHADQEDLWNEIRIVCEGTRIRTIVNGVTVTDYDGAGILDDADHASFTVGMRGHIGLQIHPGGEGRIRFKDIMLKDLNRKE